MMPKSMLLCIALSWIDISSAFLPVASRLSAPSVEIRLANDSIDKEIRKMEIEVLESSQRQMDVKRVSEFLDNDSKPEVSAPASRWTIGISAGIGAAVAAWIALHNSLITVLAFGSVALAASSDPLDDDSATGAFARLFGRYTVKSWQSSKPKLKAVVKAAVQGEDEVVQLKRRLVQLEEEVIELRTWKQRRVAIDECQSDFTIAQLKDLARLNGLKVGGSKTQLMMRLLENGVLNL
mmetsp:Transcript_313/g.521  ORF Transcript_313/g.521 Transcript_313/m.521 type:complete len:237 (-) Transcript_313:1121-1831(-)